MVKKVITLALLAVLLSGCSYLSDLLTLFDDQATGQITFSMDLSVPQARGYNVSNVHATLTHQTTQSVKEQDLTVASGSAAGTIAGLRVGTWELLVVIEEDSLEIGSGATTVQIIGDQTTQVNLMITLDTGSVQIGVTWADPGIGNTWQAAGTLATDTGVITLYQAANNAWYLGGEAGYVYKSGDNGVSWNTQGKTYTTSTDQVGGLYSTEAGVLFAGVYSDYARIMKSTDDGITWTTEQSYSGTYSGAAGINKIIALGNNVLLAEGRGDYETAQSYRSADNGQTWSILTGQEASMQGIFYFPCNDGHVNAFLSRKWTPAASYIAHSSDRGATWTTSYAYTAADVQANGSPATTRMLAVKDSIYDNALVIRSTGRNLYRSTDYGITWSGVQGTTTLPVVGLSNLGGGVVAAITMDNINNTQPAILYRSPDSGLTWNQVGAFNSALSIGSNFFEYGIAAAGNGIALLGTSAGEIYKTVDSGATWTLIKAYPGKKVTNLVYSSTPSPVIIGTVTDGTNPVEMIYSVQ